MPPLKMTRKFTPIGKRKKPKKKRKQAKVSKVF
ncbi:Uncharacterised protein [Vibrio cholerae]|nr:Uncharacterised protein [Vibrio cholerae]